MIIYTNKHKIPFMIDEEDYEIVLHYSWYIEDGRPTTMIRDYYHGIHIGRRPIYLHQFLLGLAPKGLEWDHIDRNKLNNQRKNIQLVTRTENNRNKNLQSNNISGYKGIWFDRGKWRSSIHISNRKRINLGRFSDLEEAILARKAAEIKYWGRNY